jgi:dTMP kinase
VRGFFLTLEGPEGSGKSTQARKISQYLRGAGFSVVHTREPGGTPFGEAIRKLLLDPAHRGVVSKTEFLLYEAVRSQHVLEKILPHIRRGKVVVCERFSDASMAYQGFGRGLDLKALEYVDRFATDGLVPDLTILFDLPV